jgi:hypothetical protein
MGAVSLPVALLCGVMTSSRIDYPGAGSKVVLPGQTVKFEVAKTYRAAIDELTLAWNPSTGWDVTTVTLVHPVNHMVRNSTELYVKGPWAVTLRPLRKYSAVEVEIARQRWPLW